jgi:DUF2947 family protein
MDLTTIRPLDENAEWAFFHPTHVIAPEDRACIGCLEDAAARSLWHELVSTHRRERHPMLLPSDHWSCRLEANGPNWQTSWERPLSSDDVAAFLRSRIAWPEDAEVFFIEMRERALRTLWSVFLRTWRNFLFSDEGPILVSLHHPEFVSFGPSGFMGIGNRAEPVKG